MNYGELQDAINRFASGLIGLGLQRGERVAIYLEKRFETVIASFGAPAAGGVFVPLNPLLKPEQVAYICATAMCACWSPRRSAWPCCTDTLTQCHDLRHVVVLDSPEPLPTARPDFVFALERPARPCRRGRATASSTPTLSAFSTPRAAPASRRASCSRTATWWPARRAWPATWKTTPDDTLLAALPLSFDAGFSQLTTAFHVGARVVLLNYLLPRDVLKAIEREKVTGLTAVPPLYIQLTQLEWPAAISEHLRYFANTGGRMPRETLDALRRHLPKAKPFLMYGLTEAFRSTYLPPEEVDRRPDSIGKAIPNAEILVLREDGTPCAPNEPGELVHRGALVGMGYWNDPEKTAERYKPLPVTAPGREAGLVLPEIAVFSGDTVRMDEEGFSTSSAAATR